MASFAALLGATTGTLRIVLIIHAATLSTLLSTPLVLPVGLTAWHLPAFLSFVPAALRVVGSSRRLASLLTRLRGFFSVIRNVARGGLRGAALLSGLALVVGHDLAPRVLTQGNLCLLPMPAFAGVLPQLSQ